MSPIRGNRSRIVHGLSHLWAKPFTPPAYLPEYMWCMTQPFPHAQHPGRLQWQGKGRPDALPQANASLLEQFGQPGECAQLFLGDNLAAMSHLLQTGHEGFFQLVYIDPPFCSGTDYARTLHLRGEQGGPLGEEIGKQVQYTDQWSEDEYLQFCYERILLIHALLSDTGSIVLHVDEHMSHMLRCVLDEVFGRDNFVNEIVWHYPDNFQGNVRGLANNHNLLFWYSKSRNFQANPVRIPLAGPTKRDRRVWSKTEKKVVAARDKNGKIIYDIYNDKKADDVWSIGQSAVSKIRSHEHVGYPTQKPEELLKRILQATTAPGDWVFDAFSGSGTTACVAQKMGRKWMVCDSNPVSVQTLCSRLQAILAKQHAPKTKTPKGGIPIGEGAIRSVQIVGINQASTKHRKARIDVDLQTLGTDLVVQIKTVESASLNKAVGKPVEDWRRTIKSIRIDPDYQGKVIRSQFWDAPVKADLVKTTTNIPLSLCGKKIAVHLIDVFGEEMVWEGLVPTPCTSTQKSS